MRRSSSFLGDTGLIAYIPNLDTLALAYPADGNRSLGDELVHPGTGCAWLDGYLTRGVSRRGYGCLHPGIS